MLRDYQQLGLSEIRERIKEGYQKVLLWLATGSGKTVVFCEIVKSAVERNRTAIIVVRGRKLVDQASKRLFRECVPHGTLMNKHWNYRPHLPVQVCSIDTLIARQLFPKADVIIIDEADLFSPDSKAGEFLAQYPNAAVVSVTATPYCNKGMSHIAETIVHPITMEELVKQGYLVPFRSFAPTQPDLRGVGVSSYTKDYISEQLENAMLTGQLTGKIVQHWIKHVSDRPTIGFAVNVNHSKFLVKNFVAAGVPAEHCDSDTPESEREEIIKRLESGETKVVFNVGIMGRGVDVPCVGAIILARPTKSLNLFIQQCGRGTRLFQGKTDCIILDHAGNINRHGLPTDEPDVDITGSCKSKVEKLSKTCRMCFAVFRGMLCPECGLAPPTAPEVILEETEDELREIEIKKQDPILDARDALLKEAKQRKKKTAWAYMRLVHQFGYEPTHEFLPLWFKEFYAKTQRQKFDNSPYRAINGT